MSKQNDFIKLTNVRLVYPSLFTPKIWTDESGKDSLPRFEATFILDKVKHKKEIDAINARTDEVLIPHKTNRERLEKKGYKHLAIKDPAVLDKQLDAYDNALILKATTGEGYRPVLVGKDGKTRITDSNVFYGGCYVTSYIELIVKTKHDMYVGANLRAVQFIADGERIGGTVFNPDGMFDSVESSDNDISDIDIPF
jgi:hypothetical protein